MLVKGGEWKKNKRLAGRDCQWLMISTGVDSRGEADDEPAHE